MGAKRPYMGVKRQYKEVKQLYMVAKRPTLSARDRKGGIAPHFSSLCNLKTEVLNSKA